MANQGKGSLGNFFEDFAVGDELVCPTPRVLTSAETAWHVATTNDRTPRFCSAEGRVLLIKGDTHKSKQRSETVTVDDDGNVSKAVTMLDKFVPVISAIEFTPGPNRGRIIRIS